MLAQLTFSGTITLSQVFSDIIGILTGSITTTGGLSASFNAGSSSFTNTVAPGWASYDAAAGSAANGVTPAVIRSAWSDDGTKYKNVYIGSISSTQLIFNGYETWNSGTHTGTFPMKTTPAASTWQAIDLTSSTYNGGKLIISATANHIWLQVYTNTNTPGPIIFFTEYTRDDPWSTVANGYPSWLQTGNFSGGAVSTLLDNIAIPRLYNTATLTDTTTGNSVMNADLTGVPGGLTNTATISTACTLLNSASANDAVNTQGADSSKNAAKYVFPVHVRQQAAAIVTGLIIGGDTSAKNGSVYFAQEGIGAANDTLSVGSDTYLLAVPSRNTNTRLALKAA